MKVSLKRRYRQWLMFYLNFNVLPENVNDALVRDVIATRDNDSTGTLPIISGIWRERTRSGTFKRTHWWRPCSNDCGNDHWWPPPSFSKQHRQLMSLSLRAITGRRARPSSSLSVIRWPAARSVGHPELTCKRFASCFQLSYKKGTGRFKF